MQIRPAYPEDAAAVARVHVRSWQVGYQHLLPKDYLENLKPEDRAKRYDFANTDPAKPKTFVAVENDVVAGFVTVSPAKDDDARGCGELSALYVDPDKWRRGVGTQLIAHAHAQMIAAGYSAAILWILTGNERAERFYYRHGWTADGSKRSDRVWNVDVDEKRLRITLKGAVHE